MKRMNEEEKEGLDQVYEDGYRRLPEKPDLGEAQVAMLKLILPKEDWDEWKEPAD